MTEFQDINCAFSYISSFIFLLGIIVYIYLLVVDSREESTSTRSNSDTVWIYGMFVLLIIGFLISSYCIYGTSKAEDLAQKWAPRNPFNFIGRPRTPNPNTRTPLVKLR
jgi:quinol-cytochrome oxidoreductase complex cytochrome b subunit